MPVDYHKLGDRIKYIRGQKEVSQEKLAEMSDLSRENINRIENANKIPGIDALVRIANALHVSVDDLLVDSLEYSVSTADSELHRLLLDCNKIEEQITTKTAQELKKILYRLGI
ncbi:MAG: helix-turn-helix domain-containing protein [Lachnospiraceae bacterium]|nr:helix-turn-helix domain-containing protein [Lachnospiraceae bacterium]